MSKTKLFRAIVRTIVRAKRHRDMVREFEQREERDWDGLEDLIGDPSEPEWDGSINDVYEGLDDPPDFGPGQIA